MPELLAYTGGDVENSPYGNARFGCQREMTPGEWFLEVFKGGLIKESILLVGNVF